MGDYNINEKDESDLNSTSELSKDRDINETLNKNVDESQTFDSKSIGVPEDLELQSEITNDIEDNSNKKSTTAENDLSKTVTNNNQHLDLNKASAEVINLAQDIIINNENNYYGKETQTLIKLYPWSSYEKSTIKVNKSLIKVYCEALITSRTVILYSVDEDHANYMIENVFNRAKIKSESKSVARYMWWHNSYKSKDDKSTNQDISIYDFIIPNFKKDIPTFIKLEIDSIQLLSSFYLNEIDKFNSFRQLLEDNNLYIICNVKQSLYKKIEKDSRDQSELCVKNLKTNSKFPFFKIPFLEPFIVKLFPNDYKEVWHKITLQRGKGFWGKGETEEELWDMLIATFNSDVEKIRAAIEQKDDPDYKAKQLNIIEDLPYDKTVHKIVLFIVSFFENITSVDFKMLLKLLLANQEVNIYIEEEYLNKKQKLKVRHIKKTFLAIDYWNTNGDSILKQCRVDTKQLKDGRILFEFDASIIGDIDSYFIDNFHLYTLKQYEKLIDNGLLLNTDISQELIDSLYELTINVAPYSPDKYVFQLLRNIYTKLIFKNWNDQLDQKLQLTDKTLLGKVVDKFELEIKSKRFLELMYHFLGQQELIKKEVFSFFEVVLNSPFQDHLVIFIEQLSKHKRIEPLKWVKKILDSNPNEEVFSELMKFVVSDAKEWGVDTPKKLRQICQWLPNKKHTGKYSTKQLFALTIIYEMSNPVSAKFALRFYGDFPSRFRLFNVLHLEEDTTSYFEFLIGWLFNPHTLTALADNNDDLVYVQSDLMRTRGFILESWLLIILGLEENYDDTKIKLQDNLLKAIRNTLNQEQIRQLFNALGLLSNDYSAKIRHDYLKDNKASCSLFKAKKRTALYLRSQLK